MSDMETRDKLREIVAGDVLGGWNEHHCIENQGCTICAGSRAVDAVLASGVLGVPADQRTADRETIARALFARSLDRLGPGYPTEAITWEVTDQESWRQDADAVLAVLVPVDQVRAEGFTQGHEESLAYARSLGDEIRENEIGRLGDDWAALHPEWIDSEQDLWMKARAAEYRKPAEQDAPARTDGREPVCVASWPDCFNGGYDPRCCRFPKSCSVQTS